MSSPVTRRHGRRAAGQSLTEVVIIVFLVGIGTIGLVGLFGDNLRGLFGASAEAVAGNPSVANPGQEATQTKWDLKGGSLSAYSASGGGYNPGGALNSPAPAGGGFNPAGAGSK